ncbi:MAG: hypothetical protein WB566_15310 [Terriglobales bacterium]
MQHWWVTGARGDERGAGVEFVPPMVWHPAGCVAGDEDGETPAAATSIDNAGASSAAISINRMIFLPTLIKPILQHQHQYSS